jgi:hypothetical protein
MVNIRLDQELIDRMNADKVNKTAFIRGLLIDYFDKKDESALQNHNN